MGNNLYRMFSFFLILFIAVSCNKPNDEKLTRPLVYKNGLLFSDSLSAAPFSGRHKSRMRDMKIEYEVVNGVKQGDFTIYFSNDKIQMTGKMFDNKNIGEWKYYYSSGALQTTGTFENDIPSGKWTWFQTDGRVSEEGNFLNGIRDGKWLSYDSLGKVEVIRVYKNGEIIDSTKIG